MNTEAGAGGTECPTCGRDDFANRAGMKRHHAQVHGESIAGVSVSCEHCGQEFRSKPHRTDKRRFCSEGCKADFERRSVELSCENCESGFTVQASKSENRRFCSRVCYEEGRGGPNKDCTTKLADKQWLAKQYEKKKIRKISDEIGCSSRSVSVYLDKHGVETRPAHQTAPPELRDSNQLEELYSGDGLTAAEIGERVNRTPSAVLRWVRHHGIETRTPEDWGGPRYWAGKTGKEHPTWKGGEFPYGEGWSEPKRELVRRRDNYECQGCGMSQQNHLEEYGFVLSVHHITPARQVDSPQERNAPSNLITLCKPCHSKWEQMAPLRPTTSAELAE